MQELPVQHCVSAEKWIGSEVSEVPTAYLRDTDGNELKAAILWAKDWKRAAKDRYEELKKLQTEIETQRELRLQKLRQEKALFNVYRW